MRYPTVTLRNAWAWGILWQDEAEVTINSDCPHKGECLTQPASPGPAPYNIPATRDSGQCNVTKTEDHRDVPGKTFSFLVQTMPFLLLSFPQRNVAMIPAVAAAIIFEPLQLVISRLLVMWEQPCVLNRLQMDFLSLCSHCYLIYGYRLIRSGEFYITTNVVVSPPEKVA